MNSKDLIAKLPLTDEVAHEYFCRNMAFAVLFGHNTLGTKNNTPIDMHYATLEIFEAAIYGHRKDLHQSLDPHSVYKEYIHQQVYKRLQGRTDLVEDGELTSKGEEVLKGIVKFSIEHVELLGDNGIQGYWKKGLLLDQLGDDTYNNFCNLIAGIFVESESEKSNTLSRLLNTLHAQTLLATKIDENKIHNLSKEFLDQFNQSIQQEFSGEVIFLHRVKDPHSKHTKVTTQGDKYEIDTLKDNFAGRIVITGGKNEKEREKLSFKVLEWIKNQYFKWIKEHHLDLIDQYISIEGKVIGSVKRKTKTHRSLGITTKEKTDGNPQNRNKNLAYNRLIQYLNSKKKSTGEYVERKFYMGIPDGNGNTITGEMGVVTLKEYLKNESNEGGRFYYDVIRIIEEKVRISPGRNGIIHKENIINIIKHYITARIKSTREKITSLKKGNKHKELELFNDIYTKQEFGDNTRINFLEKTFMLFGEEMEINSKSRKKFGGFLNIIAEKLIQEFIERKRLVVVKLIKHDGEQHICPNQDYLISSTLLTQRVDIGRLPAGVSIALDTKGKSNIVSTDEIQETYYTT